MTPQQILPALPRQKVKYTATGEIGEVFCTCQSEFVEFEDHPDDSIMVRNTKTGRNDCWMIEDCEPVPEEPRPWRVGDAAYNQYCGFFRVIAVKDETEVLLPNGNWGNVVFVHRPTQEEIAKYFN